MQKRDYREVIQAIINEVYHQVTEETPSLDELNIAACILLNCKERERMEIDVLVAKNGRS